MHLRTATPGPALTITVEGEESSGSSGCFAAARELARLAQEVGGGVASPLALHVRYAIDSRLALGSEGMWSITSDWHDQSLTVQAVLRSERVHGDESVVVRRYLQAALAKARVHADRTGVGGSLDGLARLVEHVAGSATSSQAGPDRAVAGRAGAERSGLAHADRARGGRSGWVAATLPTNSERVAGWQQEFQAKRWPQHLTAAPALVSAFEVVAPRLPPVLAPTEEYAFLTVHGHTGVLCAVRVPARLLKGLPDELAEVTSRLRLA